MPRIALLPEELTNQIAAGEVVERPASVVKELVENSLDAGAQRIDVDIEEGGLKLVRIADDGSGMSPEDAELSLLRHATSKLRSADDLFRLTTMGFRGEALASVASVSRLQLTTRSKDAVAAYRISMEAGQKHSPSREVGGPVGTQIEIRDLFYNVPARLKFMKTEATETGHIAETLVRLALAYPGVHFRLRSGDKDRVLLDLPPHRSALTRSQAALASRGKGQGSPTLYLAQGSAPGVSVEAHLGSPDEATTTARNVFLLVNRRFVRDRSLLQAVTTGYGELLEKGRYPLCVLHLQLDLQLVDVNVHPQKLEVRIANADGVFSAVQQAIRKVCVEAPWLLGTSRGAARPPVSERKYVLGAGLADAAHEARPRYDTSPSPQATTAPSYQPAAATATAPQSFPSERVASHAPPMRLEAPRPSGLGEHRSRLQQALKLYAPIPAPSNDGPAEPRSEDTPTAQLPPPVALTEEGDHRLPLAELPYLGQLFSTYLLCEYERELLIVDQHAAHERVLFERLRRAHEKTALASQRLLFPVHLELDEKRASLVSEYAAPLQQLGFELRPFSGKTFALTAAPDLGQYGRGATVHGEPERLLRTVLDELEEHGRSDVLKKHDELLLATMACHAATRAGDALDESRARALLAALDDVSLSPYCPHGRPVLWRLDQNEIERRFHRT